MSYESSTIQALQKRARTVREKYDELNKKQDQPIWGGLEYAAGFAGDVGALVKIIMAKEGKRSGENIDAKLSHELGDCLWSLLVIAEQYNIDLGEAFSATMDELGERLAA